MDDLDTDLDPVLPTDWIAEFERIIGDQMYYPAEPIRSIKCVCLYVENDLVVYSAWSRVCKKPSCGWYETLRQYEEKALKTLLQDTVEFVGDDQARTAILARMHAQASRFSLTDIALYNVDMPDSAHLDPETINWSTYWKTWTGEEWHRENVGWELADSVFLFHSVNTCFFVFRVGVVDVVGEDNQTEPCFLAVSANDHVRGILMKPDPKKNNKTVKKRVAFSESMVDDDDMGETLPNDEEPEWGTGQWLRSHRRKTLKRNHIFTPKMIRGFFANVSH